MEQTLKDFPFRSALSLKPLIDLWDQSKSPSTKPCLAGELLARIAQVPELNGPIEDLSVLERHWDLVESLMGVVFPAAFWETEAMGAMIPFSLRSFFASPLCRRFLVNEDGSVRGRTNMEEEDFVRGRLIGAYLLILGRLYGIHENLDYPIIRIVSDPETGLDRHFKINLNLRFVEVHSIGKPKKLTDQERSTILEHITEPEVLEEILPPENFEFRGFAVVHAVDVTESEVLSALKRDLIDQESFLSRAGFVRLQQRLRTLFRHPDLVAGLAAIQDDQVLLLNTGCEMSRSCIFADSRHVPITEFEGSVYQRAVHSGEIMQIRDLKEASTHTRAEEELLQNGVRSFLVAPLYYQGQCIGTLDLGSPSPGDLGPTDVMVVSQILPLFSMALKRALEELNNQVQGVIKEKCTAVHPSVEWRFRKAAFGHLDRLRMGQASELEPIVFKDVYPLYGVSDIRGSSEARNRAIQADLAEHLDLALAVTRWAEKAKSLPIFQELAYRIEEQQEKIQTGLGSGDEISVVGFLHREVEKIFQHLRGLSPRVAHAIDAYETAMNPNLGTVYRRRRDFEESISLLNKRISAYLDQEEAEAQTIFPHYFEKHQTDGVDYLMYIGESLVENGGFDELYLRNLRLWQLMVACGIAWHTEQLQTHMKVPLQTAHLILVNHSPLSVRFRFDEKRFDVDGAYDIRHEIIKSRIDKAAIKGSGERLTQPGKIAMVYSRAQEAREIRRHIQFLQHQGYLTGDLASLELEDLAGVQGLRTLRVAVNLESQALSERVERLAS